jgi:hypothetical protein
MIGFGAVAFVSRIFLPGEYDNRRVDIKVQNWDEKQNDLTSNCENISQAAEKNSNSDDKPI